MTKIAKMLIRMPENRQNEFFDHLNGHFRYFGHLNDGNSKNEVFGHLNGRFRYFDQKS